MGLYLLQLESLVGEQFHFLPPVSMAEVGLYEETVNKRTAAENTESITDLPPLHETLAP